MRHQMTTTSATWAMTGQKIKLRIRTPRTQVDASAGPGTAGLARPGLHLLPVPRLALRHPLHRGLQPARTSVLALRGGDPFDVVTLAAGTEPVERRQRLPVSPDGRHEVIRRRGYAPEAALQTRRRLRRRLVDGHGLVDVA